MRFVNDSKATNVAAARRALAAYEDEPVHLILGGSLKGESFAPLAAAIGPNVRSIHLVGAAAAELAAAIPSAHDDGTLARAVAHAAGAGARRATSSCSARRARATTSTRTSSSAATTSAASSPGSPWQSMSRFRRDRTTDEEERATTLELFYDLVFVFAVTQVSHILLDDLSWRGAGRTLLVLLVVWWAWNYTTWVTNELDPDSTVVRLLLLGADVREPADGGRDPGGVRRARAALRRRRTSRSRSAGTSS